jgi:V/A-type H+-transporting ATPase subunit E
MAIEDIIHALEQQADAEVKDILDAARMQADAIMEDARAEAEKIKAEKVEHARAMAESRAAQLTNSAKLDNKRVLAAARESSIEGVYSAAAGELSKLRRDGSYPALFAALAKEALDGVEGDVVVMVDPADEELGTRVLAELGVNATIDTSEPTSGGLTVVTGGGHIFRRNTLDVRLGKVRKLGQARVAGILFG